MSLHFSIIQVLKDNSSKTKTMTVTQIRNEIVKIINPNISDKKLKMAFIMHIELCYKMEH